jgi:hypothetical protein
MPGVLSNVRASGLESITGIMGITKAGHANGTMMPFGKNTLRQVTGAGVYQVYYKYQNLRLLTSWQSIGRMMVEEKQQGRAYWLGQVYVLDGYCWGTHLIGNEFVNIPLGKECEIVPILKGQTQTIPDSLSSIQRTVLQRILEEEGIEYAGSEITGDGLEGSGIVRASRDKEGNTRRSTPGKELPRSQAHHPKEGLSRK